MKQSNSEIRNRYLKKQKAYRRKRRIKNFCFFVFVFVIVFFIYLLIKNNVNKKDNQNDKKQDIMNLQEVQEIQGNQENINLEQLEELEQDKKENKEEEQEQEQDVQNNQEIKNKLSQEEFNELYNMFLNCDDITSWNLVLVNKDNLIPDNLDMTLQSISNGHSVDSRIVTQLNNMLDDAKKDGVYPYICASYRTNETQTTLYQNKVAQYRSYGYSNEEAKQKASEWVAIPGTSEHQIGLALDIIDGSYTKLDQNQENTKVQKWLMANSYKYGFILRYPNDKKDITKINYEPWHYRYVGVNNAKVIYENDLTLEEFIDKYNIYLDNLYNYN